MNNQEGINKNSQEENKDEKMVVYFSDDDMVATVEFLPPDNENDNTLTIEDIKRIIREHQIVYGIDEKLLNELVENKEYYNKYEIAKGDYPIKGKDGILTYHFETERKLNPKVNEDGSVDFHSLNIINNVTEGDVLVTLTPHVEGKAGKDIFGKIVQPPEIIRLKLPKHGRNIKLSDNELELITEIEGQVELKEGKLLVNEVYTIQGDVNNSTGDIDFTGSVLVTGNVLSGFSIKAKKNVEIRGIAEGATIIAGGNIIIHKGIQGMDKARIICNGSLNAKYIYNAFVKTNDTILVEAILHSFVSCNDIIKVEGVKGLVSGGQVRANKEIHAKVIGASLGTKTKVEVGVDPDVLEKYQELKKQFNINNNEKKKLEQIVSLLTKRKHQNILDEEKLKLLEKSELTLEKLIKEQSFNKKKIEQLMPLVENSTQGKIRASYEIKPGTIVTIGSFSKVIDSTLSRCTLLVEKGDIKIGVY